MVVSEKSKEGTDEGQEVKTSEIPKAKGKKGLCVSIQKGKLVFLPTALEKTAPAPPDETKSSGSEED